MFCSKRQYGIETFFYDSVEERNKHINSYGKKHLITAINGDNVNTPLSASFEEAFRLDYQMHVYDLAKEQIIQLRREIILDSYFYKDYENSFAIDSTEVFNFFSGYTDFISELEPDEDYYYKIGKYDTDELLLHWFEEYLDNIEEE